MKFNSSERLFAVMAIVGAIGTGTVLATTPTITSSQESLRLHFNGNCLYPDRLNITAEGLNEEMQPLNIKIPKGLIILSERTCKGNEQKDITFFQDTAPALCWVDHISSFIHKSERLDSCFIGRGEITGEKLSFRNGDVIYPFDFLAR